MYHEKVSTRVVWARSLTFALFFALCSTLHAELHVFEVRGLADSPKADSEGFSVVLVDSGSDVSMVQGIAAVPDEFGPIESAVLIVTDAMGKRISRSILGAQRLAGSTSDYEFNLRRDLLAHSIILVSRRQGDDVTIARLILGSFQIREINDSGRKRGSNKP